MMDYSVLESASFYWYSYHVANLDFTNDFVRMLVSGWCPRSDKFNNDMRIAYVLRNIYACQHFDEKCYFGVRYDFNKGACADSKVLSEFDVTSGSVLYLTAYLTGRCDREGDRVAANAVCDKLCSMGLITKGTNTVDDVALTDKALSLLHMENQFHAVSVCSWVNRLQDAIDYIRKRLKEKGDTYIFDRWMDEMRELLDRLSAMPCTVLNIVDGITYLCWKLGEPFSDMDYYDSDIFYECLQPCFCDALNVIKSGLLGIVWKSGVISS